MGTVPRKKASIRQADTQELKAFRSMLDSVGPMSKLIEGSWRRQTLGMKRLDVLQRRRKGHRPALPLFHSGKPGLARRTDKALDRFGEE
jgi:hypothetical protein